MSAQTAVVIPGRLGDIINVLPCVRDIALKEGGKCAVVVSSEFASVLEGCSYAEAVVISSHFTDIQPAIAMAQAMFPRVLVAKINEKAIGTTAQCESFSEESWRQIGYLERYGDLPLVFDRRSREREQTLRTETLTRGNGKQPIALVNFTGKSAPFDHGRQIVEAIFQRGCQVVDLGLIKAHRIYDLLGLMDAADLLVTCDTATLHLAAASGIPTINLIGDKPTRWHGSKPRNNSVREIRYSELPQHLATLFDVEMKWRPRTWHVWSDYAMSGDTRRRHEVAQETWRNTGWIDFPVTENERVMNDQIRRVPFVKDMVRAAVSCAGPKDVIVLTNSDTCVSTECSARVAEAVQAQGCCYSFRRDFPSVSGAMTTAEIREGRFYEGSDLFAFTVDWWREHERTYPDMLLGTETWDWAMRTLMKNKGGVEFDDLIAHESHPNVWETQENRYLLPSQQHNRKLASQFLAAQGVV